MTNRIRSAAVWPVGANPYWVGKLHKAVRFEPVFRSQLDEKNSDFPHVDGDHVRIRVLLDEASPLAPND